MSPPPPLLYSTSSPLHSSDGSQYAQRRPGSSLTSLQSMQQAHHYQHDMRADPEFHRLTRQCILVTTPVHGHRAQMAKLPGGDLGRFPVRKIVLPEEHFQTPDRIDSHQGISGHHATCPSLMPSRPPMQSEDRTQVGNVHVPSGNDTARLSAYSKSNDSHLLFNPGRGGPHSRPLASAPSPPSDRAAQLHYLRTFGNPQAVPLMMARSSTSIPSQGTSRPLIAGPAGSAGGGVLVRDAPDWPAMIMGSPGVLGIRTLGRPMMSL